MIERVGRQRTEHFDRAQMRAGRQALGWSQGRLAAELEVSIVSIAAWERGARAPQPPVLLALATVINVDPADLLITPRARWTLVELRTVAGLHQQAAARAIHVGADRLRYIEAGYQRPDERLRAALADVYRCTGSEIDTAWQRGRDRLLAG